MLLLNTSAPPSRTHARAARRGRARLAGPCTSLRGTNKSEIGPVFSSGEAGGESAYRLRRDQRQTVLLQPRRLDHMTGCFRRAVGCHTLVGSGDLSWEIRLPISVQRIVLTRDIKMASKHLTTRASLHFSKSLTRRANARLIVKSYLTDSYLTVDF